ncbi:hypothetical protein GCM10028801_44660 [Nocardioides maradonensis]
MTTHRPLLTAAATALLAGLLGGCGHTSPATSSQGTSTSSSTSTASTTPSTDAVSAARTVFTTWDQPTLDYGTWWTQLQPLLSPAGQQAYAGTDPANIPALKITGPYRLDPKAPDDPATTALVHVQTDRGPFALFMEHAGPGQPWYLLQIEFPPGIH